MDVFDPCLRQFHAEDILAESSFVTPRGFAYVSHYPNARSLQLSDVGIYVHSLIAKGVEVQSLRVAAFTRAGDRITNYNHNRLDEMRAVPRKVLLGEAEHRRN